MLGFISPIYSVHHIDLVHFVRVIDLVNRDSIYLQVVQTQYLHNNGIIEHRKYIGKLLRREL